MEREVNDTALQDARLGRIGAKVAVRTRAKLRASATDYMKAIETLPDHVKIYFQDQMFASPREVLSVSGQ